MKLIQPSTLFQNEHETMLSEWSQSGETPVPFTLKYKTSDFEKYIQQRNGFKTGIGIPDTFVSHSTLWLVNECGKILGVSNIRHSLNERSLRVGRHIGFGIRPSERNKGYATEILKLSLMETRKMNIQDVLVTCSKSNTASSKVIIKNGGILWKEHLFEDIITQNYWIKS